MGYYDEYLNRASWGPSEPLHNWVAIRILKAFEHFARLRPETTNLLEIGAGTGRVGLLARRIGYKTYVGVEPTKALAEYCRDQHGLHVVEEALPTLSSLRSSTYDAVFSMHLLEHASNPREARDWCQEMVRVLRPGGAICIVAPDIRDYRQYFWDGDWSHGYPTTPQRVGQLLRDLGLDVEFEGSMRLGTLNLAVGLAARSISALLPTRFGDSISKWITGRPLVSGLKMAVLWGLVFVVARKSADT